MPRQPEAGVDDDLAGGAPVGALAVGHGVRVAGEPVVLEGENGGGEVVAAAEAQELVLAQGLVAVGGSCGFEQLRELLEVLRVEL